MDDSIKNIELRSEEVNDILTHIPPWLTRWGNLMLLLLIVLILMLSWIIKYPDIITAQVYITTEEPPQKVFAKTNARIDTILVTDKQKVYKNTVLSILENASNSQDVFILKSVLDTITFNQDNIYFPFTKLPILILGDIESKFAQFENSYFQYTMNRDLQPYSNEVLANEVSLAELKRRLLTLARQKKTSNSELNFKKESLERNKELFQKGIIAKQTYEDKQAEYLSVLKTHQSIDVSISQLREALSKKTNTFETISYNRTREETQLLKSVLQSYVQLKRAVREWELKYVLKSNIKGEVAFLNYWNNNQSVTNGDLVFTISPLENLSYIAKLKTQKTNTGKVKIGQRVNLKLYDYPDYEFGVLRGKVNHISTISDKEGTYIVDVILSEKLITSFGKKIEFKQEMKGEADIITEDLRLLERFFYQLKRVSNR